MFYLNEQTICPILTGKQIKSTRYNAYTCIYILHKICLSILMGFVLFAICLRGLKI